MSLRYLASREPRERARCSGLQNLWFFKNKETDSRTREEQDTDLAEDEDHEALVCRACGFEISTRDEAIEVAGQHEHVFFNPAGVLFRIACFSSAPGCRNSGQATTEFSWFPGFSWMFSSCGQCQRHLGWRFQSGESPGFYGLIINRLSRAEGSSGS